MLNISIINRFDWNIPIDCSISINWYRFFGLWLHLICWGLISYTFTVKTKELKHQLVCTQKIIFNLRFVKFQLNFSIFNSSVVRGEKQIRRKTLLKSLRSTDQRCNETVVLNKCSLFVLNSNNCIFISFVYLFSLLEMSTFFRFSYPFSSLNQHMFTKIKRYKTFYILHNNFDSTITFQTFG